MIRYLPFLSLVSPVACHAEAPVVEEISMEDVSMADLKLTLLDGRPFASEQLKDKVVLFVNVASKCGFTPQYDGLQKLYDEKKDDGLVIVGVPCNQFGWQEPGSSEAIAEFCKINYGVTFPILEKQDVNGGERSALYRYLVNSTIGGGARVKWNFEKFLVSRKGQVLSRYGSRTTPEDKGLQAAIAEALSSK
jgi:glutathione peroxidase-family protein